MRFAVLICTLTVALASEVNHDPFTSFMAQFSKQYAHKEEMASRREIFMNNLRDMVEHNKLYGEGKVTWFKKVHKHMDLTPEEWMETMVPGLPPYNATDYDDGLGSLKLSEEELAKLPRDFSWVDYGVVSSAKDQAACGSCAAFATMGGVETCFAQVSGYLDDDLSEQHILDCALGHTYIDLHGVWLAGGCQGGWPQSYIHWLTKHYGQAQEESSYPYTSGSTSSTGTCAPNQNGYNNYARVTGMANYYSKDESNMINMLQYGPVVTTIGATDSFGSYGGGVLHAPDCCDQASNPLCKMQNNHAVLVVGYGTENGQDYWLIKNSWSRMWGVNGFFKLFRGSGHCGIGAQVQTNVQCST